MIELGEKYENLSLNSLPQNNFMTSTNTNNLILHKAKQ